MSGEASDGGGPVRRTRSPPQGISEPGPSLGTSPDPAPRDPPHARVREARSSIGWRMAQSVICNHGFGANLARFPQAPPIDPGVGVQFVRQSHSAFVLLPR
jgi:hypothetical protein